MKIKERWFNFRWGIINFLVVTTTYGYFGDCHIAVNYAYLHHSLMSYLRDIISFQASRRGIKLKEGISSPKAKAMGIRNALFI